MGRFAENDIILKNYRIEKSIGQGAFGEVYLATHLGLNGKRAVKVLLRDEIGMGSSDYDEYRNRFRQESQLMEWFKHPNVVTVYDFQEEDGVLFLVMEYATGGNLQKKLEIARRENERFTVDEVVRVGIDIAEGLSALHAKDVVHRDLKPSNILFDVDGRAKVADLGLAQVPGGASMRSQLSIPKPHPGTPAYMSPEQEIAGSYLRPASDVYALGLILFEMLAGRSYKNIRPGTLIKSLAPGVPDWFDELLRRMLAESPKDRPWDGAEAVNELRTGLAAGDEKMREAREKARLETEERARLEAEEHERRVEAEKARREEEERVRLAAEKKARLEAEERARREAAEKVRREEEERIRLQRVEKIRLETEAREKREAEKERVRLEALEKSRKEAEERAKREAEINAEKERVRLAALEKTRKEAEERARQEAEEKTRLDEQIRELEKQGTEACETGNWETARQTIKSLKRLGKDGHAAAARIKPLIKDTREPIWKKYGWAFGLFVVFTVGAILWLMGLFPTGSQPITTATGAVVSSGGTQSATAGRVASATAPVLPTFPADFTATAAMSKMPAGFSGTLIEYTTQSGDTLESIAAKFAEDADLIAKINNLSGAISAGQKILVPLPVSITPVAAGVTSTPIFTEVPTMGIPDGAGNTPNNEPLPTVGIPTEVSNKPMPPNGTKIGLSFGDLQSQRWKDVDSQLKELFAGKGYEVISMEANYDTKMQEYQIETMVSQGIKGLIVIAEDGDAAVTAVEKAAEAGVKVLAYDRVIQTARVSAYLGFDQIQIGYLQATAILNELNIDSGKWSASNPAKIVLLGGSPTDPAAQRFRQGQSNALDKYYKSGVVKIVQDQWVENWDPAKAQNLMETVIVATAGKFDGVIASNDGTALGAVQAMKAAKISVPISGQDATADGCNSILKGELTATILKDVRLMPVKAYEIMETLLTGGSNKDLKNYPLSKLTSQENLTGEIPVLFIPPVTITKDNIYDAIVKSEWQYYDDVYRDIPDNLRPPKP